MLAYAFTRILVLIPTLAAASLLVFLFIHLIPGDPAAVLLGDTATPEDVAALTRELGLDEPLYKQFLLWFRNLLQGGFPSILDEGGIGNLRYLLLPSLTLAAPNAALIIRLVRASMLDVQREDYVRTARAKGLHPARVAYAHVFRNALIAVAAAFGFTFAALVSEAVVTETVFSLPGIGRLVVQSILRRDYPVIQGVILVIVVLYMFVNLLVDFAYAWLDPRVSLK